MPKKTHSDQVFTPGGDLVSETPREETDQEYHERLMRERLETIIEAAQAKITKYEDTYLPAVEQLQTDIDNASNLSDLKPILQTMQDGHAVEINDLLDIIKGVHALAKTQLQYQMDQLEVQ